MTRIVHLLKAVLETETGIKDVFGAKIRGIARIKMDKETKRRIDKLERRLDKYWVEQNRINQKMGETMSTILDMYAKYGHSTSERLQ